MDLLKSLLSTIAPGIATLLGGPAAGAIMAMLASKLLGKSSASPDELIAALSDPTIIVKLKELDVQLAQAQAQVDVAQATINAEDSKSDDKFKSYWRPAFGWLGVLLCLNNYFIVPYLAALGIHIVVLDMDLFMPIILGILGIGTMRTVERIKGK